MNDEITIDGIVYVAKEQQAKCLEGMEYKIVRTRSAGVFAGYIEKHEGLEVVVRKARRLWQWAGAASLSQFAMEGTKEPGNCKFPVEVDKITLTEAIEILDCTNTAQASIAGVEIWEA